MADSRTLERRDGNPDMTAAIRKRMLQVAFALLIQAAILFITAGRLDWVMAWAYVGMCVAIVIINLLVILPRDPELIAERGQVKDDAKAWDRWLGMIAGAVSPMIMLIVAGLDERFGWSPKLALAIQLAGLVLVALGYGLVCWAMASNKFFSTFVRIQKERGHTVANTGPYRIVRHPGYVGMLIYSLATPVLLGSLWALIPAGLTVVAFVVRTALEDRTLQDELDGYRDYARQVCYRLLPGVW